MNKRIKKKIAKRKQNEEFVKWVKAEIANQMADAFLEELLGPLKLEIVEAEIKHRCELSILRAVAHESMYGKDIIF